MSIDRVLIFIGVVSLLGLVLVAFRPWELLAEYRVRYLRQVAVEVAEAIDSRSSVRLRKDFTLANVTAVLTISKPREMPLTLRIAYFKLGADTKETIPSYLLAPFSASEKCLRFSCSIPTICVWICTISTY